MVVSGVYQFLLVVLFFGWSSVEALDNGLALTPPMGFNTWLRYRCNKNCESHPDECISENLIKRTADLMVSDGYLAAGYQYIVIDSCWQDRYKGEFAADRNRFPSGMRALADYVHSKGLKLGLFTNSYNNVRTFASWNIDYLKFVDSYDAFKQRNRDFDTFEKSPNPTYHSILYGCWWPMADVVFHNNAQTNYHAVVEHCNSWRNYIDNDNNWSSTVKIMSWYADNQDRLAPHAGPGHWNDPDMLSVGNSGLTENQAQVEMAIWTILAAPLIMSVDLATIKPEYKKILLNSEIITVNQDKLGQQGLRIWQRDKLEVWNRKLSDGCYALAFVNLCDDMMASHTFSHEEMKLPLMKFGVMDLYDTEAQGYLKANRTLNVWVDPTSVRFFKFTPYYKPLSTNQRKKGLIFQHIFKATVTDNKILY